MFFAQFPQYDGKFRLPGHAYKFCRVAFFYAKLKQQREEHVGRSRR